MKIVFYLLQFFLYVFFSLGFYVAVNNLYFEAGKVVDYSIYAWIGMFLIWGIALYRYSEVDFMKSDKD